MGALLNLLSNEDNRTNSKELKHLLSEGIATGIIQSCLFDTIDIKSNDNS